MLRGFALTLTPFKLSIFHFQTLFLSFRSFSAMEELDGDEVRVSSRGRLAERDIVQVLFTRSEAHFFLQILAFLKQKCIFFFFLKGRKIYLNRKSESSCLDRRVFNFGLASRVINCELNV